MHLLVRESRSLDEAAPAEDLGQSPADLVLLSFSDSDLGAAASAWESWGDGRPSLRLANLRRLLHPMSVDLYAEQVLARARGVIVRVLGGLEYWRYGVEEVAALCRARGIALALLPGDGRDDAALLAHSTVPEADWAALAEGLRQGGAENLRRALGRVANIAGILPGLAEPPLEVPEAGEWGVPSAPAPWARAAILFYRSHLLAGDTAPVAALAAALVARGLAVRAYFAASLKSPAGRTTVEAALADWRPDVVVNLTAFSAPVETQGAPVLQAVLAGSPRASWEEAARGLGGSDLAMHVVLPELDGRLLTTAISFKREQAEVAGLEFARTLHEPDSDGVALAADRAAGWARLARSTAPRVAYVLSDYPGGGRVGQAVGLDTFASVAGMVGGVSAEALVGGLCEAAPVGVMRPETYRALFASLPDGLQQAVRAAWGEAAEADLAFRTMRCGDALVAVQPDRGSALDRKAGYHDPDCPPRHGYVAFYLWLRLVERIDALVHVGAHGTLEWLPGKAVALSAGCGPVALLRGLPVIYPFIANNPGEAAAAKRRLGAVTIGHLPPPLTVAGLHGEAAALEALLEEYAAADGMDRRRAAWLRREILVAAERSGLLAEAGAEEGEEADRLARLDAHLCDLKDAQIRDGLHVFGQGAPGEMAGLRAAVGGRFVPPGPAGAPSRGRADVLPTGRNLTTIDPRAVPTRSAMTLARAAADEVVRRHLQERGEYPSRLVLNLWGSTTMRTGGEDLALAFLLLGAEPEWDASSGRVTGLAILPIATLERPRVDVTLRISGLFRDAFPVQIALFDQAVRAVAARDEAVDWNPLAGANGSRVFGPPPGLHGAGVGASLEAGCWSERGELGAAYASASAHAYGTGGGDFATIARRADAYVQIQDHYETDLLEGTEWAAHAGGLAALGGGAALYHLDTGAPGGPRARTVAEEVARIVRVRAANPRWIAGMRRHGYRGASEIARTLDALFAHAALLDERFDRQFELLWGATLGDAETDEFLRTANPDARTGMTARFAEARARDLWRSGRNDWGER